MDRQEKIETVSEFQGKFSNATVAIVTEYRGLSVGKMTQLRRDIRSVMGEYRIVKNSLARLALEDTAYRSLDKFLQGPNGWVLGYEDPVSLSKALIKFAEQNEALVIKAGVVEGELLDRAAVGELAKMPSRPELQAKLLSLMQAPAVQLLRTMQEPGAELVRLMEALRKKNAEVQG